MSTQRKVKILYVEDDESLSFVTVDNLTKRGYDVTLCKDGLSAFQEFQQKKFDICILDVMLPKIDGFAVAQKIRDRDTHIPILFLTAKSMMEDKMHGFKLGADDYITKPFSMEELLYKLDIFLRRSRVFVDAVDKVSTFNIRDYV
ncbi:MAG: response regulator transcription factor, partial [Chitinophagales bacterium]